MYLALSVAVPVCNALTFAFTAVAGRAMGETQGSTACESPFLVFFRNLWLNCYVRCGSRRSDGGCGQLALYVFCSGQVMAEYSFSSDLLLFCVEMRNNKE